MVKICGFSTKKTIIKLCSRITLWSGTWLT